MVYAQGPNYSLLGTQPPKFTSPIFVIVLVLMMIGEFVLHFGLRPARLRAYHGSL